MFGKKSEKTQTVVEQKPKLLTISDLTEQPDFISAMRLIPQFNLQHIPDDFLYKDSLVLKEEVKKDEDGVVHRKDYIVTPKRGIRVLSGDRVAVDSALSLRFDDVLGYLNNLGDTREFIFGKKANIKRFLAEDGNEIYTYNGIEMLEVRADICKECKTCHETAPNLYFDKSYVDYNESKILYSSNRRIIRDVREYKINPPFLGLLFGTGVHIAQLSHPCQWKNLHEILNPHYEVADPPEIKIVFPKQEK